MCRQAGADCGGQAAATAAVACCLHKALAPCCTSLARLVMDDAEHSNLLSRAHHYCTLLYSPRPAPCKRAGGDGLAAE